MTVCAFARSFCRLARLGTIWERALYILCADKERDAMKQPNLNGHYDADLLRIWRGGEQNHWRWMLQNIRTGEQRGFRDMEALVNHLNDLYGASETPTLNFQIQE
jgi:hypothetical protein